METPSWPAIHRDPYEVLGVSRASSSVQISLAFKKLALRYHPDKNVDDPEASEHFKEVSYCYSLLSDPERRRCYDNGKLQVYSNINLSTTDKASGNTGLVVDTSDVSSNLSPEDINSVEEIYEDTILSRQTSVNAVPFIGQRFVSQDAAYELYCSFAKQCGFSIRRHRTRGKDGVGRGITRRDFTCHRGGFPQAKQSDDGKLQRNRKSSRCGCQAYMRIVKKTDFDIPEWRITGFSNVHNHELLKSNEVHLLPAYSSITADDKSRICMFAKAGMSIRQMLRLFELEKGMKLGCLPFTEIDVQNLLKTFKIVDRNHDALDLLAMCKRFKDEDPNFKYEFKIDTHNRLEHIAWSYASSIRLYESFGDAVVFDTTHRLDSYDMLLGIWIGVDNHGTDCFFSCVLLRDESSKSFSWALKTFLGFMNGKAPQSILTDQNMWLKEAISVEMPTAKHAFCIWHIIAKFSDWFSVLLGAQYDNWKVEFHRLYNLEAVEEFEVEWGEMVNLYGLHTNKHVASLFALRTFWALPYLRCYFFAGMTSTSYSESINSFIQRFLSAQSQADSFVKQVLTVVNVKDQVGASPKTNQKLHGICLKTGAPLESHAASVLTPYAFAWLQEEIISSPQYASFPVENGCFLVRYHTQMSGGCKVFWVPQENLVSCSCRRFEFLGILCRHILRVLSTNNCFQIPDGYLPNRWRCISSPLPKGSRTTTHVERVHVLQNMVSSLITESIESEERLEVASEQIATVLSRLRELPAEHGMSNVVYGNSSESLVIPEVEDGINHSFPGVNNRISITLQNVKDNRSRDGVDSLRKRRRYTQFEQDARDCPMAGIDGLNGEDMGFL